MYECWTGSCSGLVTTSRSGLWSVAFRNNNNGLRSFVCLHLLVYLLQVQTSQVHASRMLDEVLPKELEALVVLTKEYNVVLASLLKGFNGLGNNGLDLLICSL